MRILQLITHLEPGGAQETVVLLSEGLRRAGHDVTVAARLGGALQQRLEAADVPLLDVVDLGREISPPRDARAYRELLNVFAGDRFDVVHTHSSKAGVLGRLAARRAGVPVVIHTSHGLPINPDMSRIEREIALVAERRAGRASDRIVAVSQATAQELLDLRLARSEQIAVIPSGIDVDRFADPRARVAARETFGLPTDAQVVGWVGRHFPQKRPDLILRVARRIVRDVPSASFLMVGDGPSFADAVAAAADEPRIRVVGFRDDVETAYAAMDLFLLASAWEGLPRTVLEAGAAGVPIVATDVNGVGEVVRDGETGRLVDLDEAALGDAVLELLRERATRERMGVAIRAVVDATYSSRHTIDACQALYHEVVAAEAAPRRRPRRSALR